MKTDLIRCCIYSAIILILVTECVLTQSMQKLVLNRNESFVVRGEVTFKVDLEWDRQLIPTEQPTIVIETSLHSDSQSNAVVNFVVLYGQHSEYWKQEINGKSKITLCIDHLNMDKFPTSLVIIAQKNPHVSQVGINILVRKKDLSLRIGEKRNVSISDDDSATFLVNHSSREGASRQDTFIIYVDTPGQYDKDECMAITVYQRYQCPLHDKPGNVFTADIWSTALAQSTTTVKAEGVFSRSFYVSVVLLQDQRCRTEERGSKDFRGRMHKYDTTRRKTVTIQVKEAMHYNSYILPILVGFVPMAILIIFGMLVIRFKKYPKSTTGGKTNLSEIALNKTTETAVEKGTDICDEGTNGISVCENLEDIEAPYPPKEELDAVEEFDPHSLAFINASEIDGPILRRLDKLWEEYQSINKNNNATESSSHKPQTSVCRDDEMAEKLEKKRFGLMRLKSNPMLSDMTTILSDDKWFRRNRSKVYLYLVPIIVIFYFVPSIQYVLQTKWTETLLGTQDICFHNFRCSRPFWIFDDFNHVISNIPYIIFGLSFIIIVKIKATRLPEDHQPKNDHLTTTGTLQQLSIFYAMGLCLMAQGMFSVCYHVCPTNLSLQFDTTMMYVMSILSYVKIYQFRHPNAIQNAYSTFMVLGILVLLEAVVLFSESILVYLPFVVFYIGLTIFLSFDLYYHGVGRIDMTMGKLLAKDIATAGINSISSHSRKNKNQYRKFIRYPGRFWFSFIFFLINLGYAIFVTYQKIKDGSKTISHVLLVILCGNMMFYLFYYIVRKGIENWNRKKIEKDNIHALTEDDTKSKCQKLNCFKYHPGPCFAIIALILGLFAISFYLSRSANRNLSAAESRDLNAYCSFLQFYDNHDLWHFFSAAGCFMAFLALLTVDDDLLATERENIEVF